MLKNNGHFRAGLACVVIGFVVANLGCRDEAQEVVDVQGRVTYQGRPVTIGTISFSPKDAGVGSSQRPATAVLEADGSYRLKAFRSRFGMPPGEYAVSVLSYEGSMLDPSSVKYLVPKKFSETGTSGLLATIPASHSGTLELNFDIE